ncbi:cystathionine beta-lyase, partial [Faecalicoccus pleomorphus]|nr:cystathionine beta-lyase [Faecalicoccus pleomorphus]
IQEAKLGLNNGGDFERGLEGYMRLNVACPRSVLKQAMKQLEKAVNSRNERK